jgi:hypothetical protein
MHRLVLVLALVLFAGWLKAQTSPEELMLANQQELTKLTSSYKNNNAGQFNKCRILSGLFTNFATRLEKTSQLPPDYNAVLLNYFNLLKKANQDPNSSDAMAILDFISTDITLKSPNTPALIEQLSKKIIVVVDVINSKGEKLGGYNVFAKYYLEIDSTQHEQFNPTNNAQKFLLPGWYIFWITKQGNKIAERSDHVTLTGANHIIFNLD